MQSSVSRGNHNDPWLHRNHCNQKTVRTPSPSCTKPCGLLRHMFVQLARGPLPRNRLQRLRRFCRAGSRSARFDGGNGVSVYEASPIKRRRRTRAELERIMPRRSALRRLPSLLMKWGRAVDPTKETNKERTVLFSEDSVTYTTARTPALCTTSRPVPRPCSRRY